MPLCAQCGRPRPSRVAGDYIGDRVHHGGSRQAVYAVGREDLDRWGGVLRCTLPDGWMGENPTTLGANLHLAVVGSQWCIGAVELQVRDPRFPCSTFKAVAARLGWLKELTVAGGSGTYLLRRAPRGGNQPELPLRVEERRAPAF